MNPLITVVEKHYESIFGSGSMLKAAIGSCRCELAETLILQANSMIHRISSADEISNIMLPDIGRQ
ncbi:MAG: hypothetical protein WCA63_08360 [Gallionella sp.]